MNEYTHQRTAQLRLEETARNARHAHLAAPVTSAPRRRHLPRVRWHLPVHARAAGT